MGCGDLFDYLLTERQEESWDVTTWPHSQKQTTR